MNLHHRIYTALLFGAVTTFAATAAGATQPQQAPTLKLSYANGTQTCTFHTDNGVTVSGSVPDTIEASGSFDTSCNIGGGGNTGPASVSVTTTQTSIMPGEAATITWSANADVCRFDGSVLPEIVPGWKTSGYACTQQSACTGGSIGHTFNTSGTYQFKLTCNSGVGDSQTATATVSVGGAPPPNDDCQAPSGWTRQLTATIAQTSGANQQANVPVTTWEDVLGWALSQGTHSTWPGSQNNNTKIAIYPSQYVSMRFTVPNSYPYFEAPSYYYGRFQTNASPLVSDNTWALSISPTCGDFNQPAAPDPDSNCYIAFNSQSMPYISWVVSPVGLPVAGRCNLHRGQQYFLNIAPRTLTSPANLCTGSRCHVNIINGGNTAGTYTEIP